jgi:hypothetical protein
MEFATWATKEQDVNDLIKTAREINELLDGILPPLPEQQKRSDTPLMEPKPSTLAPKSDEPTVLIPMEQQIQQRAYELYEQRGRTDGHDLGDWLQAECEIKGTQANAATAIALAALKSGHDCPPLACARTCSG